ncbi:MAG: sulfatase [Candidatus Latescibacteria bacterium]|jgi:arylsulfatase A-like enzyme|nr:sulfatase [Candidatus Latescibacterota bacterium]
MKRRQFMDLSVWAATAAAVFPHVLTSSSQAALKRNVLFISIDDLRPELNCYGASHIHSPNIDRLAESGTLFRRAYCQQAVCNPSRASLMTGLRPDTSGVIDLPTHFRDRVPDVVTIPQHFMNNGWHSQGMGKIYHTGHGNRDDKFSWSVPHQRPRINNYLLKESLQIARENRKKNKADKSHRWTNGPPTEMADVVDEAYRDGATARLAVETLNTLVDQPFFLATGFSRPHLPFCAPKKYWDLYDRSKIELPDNYFPQKNVPSYAPASWGELRKYHGIPPEGSVSEEQALTMIHGYYACVSYIDAQVGLMLNELDRLGLRDNTSVVLWGDHGWKLGEHAAWCKHSNVEDDTNAPLICSDPDLSGGHVTDALVEFVDVYPTLCELAGLSVPSHVEGDSYVPLMQNPKREWKTAAFSQYPRGRNRMGYTMRTDRYRYTEWVSRDVNRELLAQELYDHKTDPQENVNVINDSAYASVVPKLAKQMKSGWQGARPR